MSAALWTLYAIGVVAVVVSIWIQAGKCDRAERELERLRDLHDRPHTGTRNRSP